MRASDSVSIPDARHDKPDSQPLRDGARVGLREIEQFKIDGYHMRTCISYAFFFILPVMDFYEIWKNDTMRANCEISGSSCPYVAYFFVRSL